MSKLARAVKNVTVTENDAVAFNSSLDACVDLFFKAGSSRKSDLSSYFYEAFKENPDYAVRIALWTRDIRGGAGERQQFANFVKKLITVAPSIAAAVCDKIPEVGRFDDLMVFWGTVLEHRAAELWVAAINEGNGLAAKWAPRKDSKGAKPLRSIKGFNESEWRKYVVARTEVVEQLMCANKWDEIDYEKVPSLASARYNKAFDRHDPIRRQKFEEALESGEAKINAGAVFPYDVVRAAKHNDKTATAQWNSLPNYLEGVSERFLPVVDVSGSMGCTVSGEITAMEVAVSLGMYLAERNEGIFNNQFITFSRRPDFVTLKGKTLKERYDNMVRAQWDMNTDLAAVFRLVLSSAKRAKLPESEMPTKILILSDMQFDCVDGGKDQTLYEYAAEEYSEAGYKLPQIVFWNIAARDKGNLPVTATTNGTALVSGFSPAIMTSLLGGDLDPVSVMLDAIMKDRYAIL